MTGIELSTSAGAELAHAAWDLVNMTERMRMLWAETDGIARYNDLWTPVHTAADTLRERLELLTCERCRNQLTEPGDICASCEIRQDDAFKRGADV